LRNYFAGKPDLDFEGLRTRYLFKEDAQKEYAIGLRVSSSSIDQMEEGSPSPLQRKFIRMLTKLKEGYLTAIPEHQKQRMYLYLSSIIGNSSIIDANSFHCGI
jgi:hypothetical protein